MTDKNKIETVNGLPGVGPATMEKLTEAGYTDLISIAVATTGQLIDATGMTEATAKKLINSARENCDMDFMDASEYDKKREGIFKIPTGVEGFDEMLEGGFESGSISECFGEYGSSKTQIAHQLAVNTFLKNGKEEEKDDETFCIYIDTEGSFRPSRIKQMAKGAGLDEDYVLKHIKVARAFSSDHQVLLGEQIDELIQKEGLRVKLVIVDSLTAHFRAEFVGRGTLADRQQRLNKHMKQLSKLAFLHNLTVYVTNQVSADPAQMFGDPTKAIGGHIVGHNSTYRIYLRKGRKGSRVAKLLDAPHLPDSETAFMVTVDGLKEV